MKINHWVKYVLFSSAIGAIAETIAYLGNLWVFDPWWFFMPWFFIWEGLCFGSLAYGVSKYHPALQFGLSALVGGTLEVINAWVFPIWVFPGEVFLFISGLLMIVVVITFFWGLYTPALILVMSRVFGMDKD